MINSSNKAFVFADKTRNIYKLDKAQYDKLLRENISTCYKKSDTLTLNSVNQELKDITTNLNVDDRIETMTKKQAFITLKDHKDNFSSNPKCRLINPTKSNLGLISKEILDKINSQIRLSTNAKQWRNTQSVIDWFTSIEDKHRCTFLIFDIVDFYPSISESLLKLSLDYARQFIPISEEDLEIIMHARKSILFDNNEPWTKKGNASNFDVAMGSYDGAEICELVGLYILHRLSSINNNGEIGLYRDDGLAAFKGMGARSLDKVRKEFEKTLGELGLKITIQTNMKVVNYLDITLNLQNGKFYPFRKPDNQPLYINAKSNHPPPIIKQLPAAINRRISALSYDAEEFEKASQPYNDALESSGFKEKLKFVSDRNQSANTRNRARNIIWFNPPYSESVHTNVGGTFLRLIEKHFPRSHPLRTLFNRNTVKISYSCTRNMASIIKSHNTKITATTPEPDHDKCNCRNKQECPLDTACLSKSIVYKATVTTDANDKKLYIGMTEHTFKSRYNNHKKSFKHRKHSHDTVLSKYIWDLKDNSIEYSIKWSILKRSTPYKGGFTRCNLCLAEKLSILTAEKSSLLNKRSELITKCRHESKFLAANHKQRRPP